MVAAPEAKDVSAEVKDQKTIAQQKEKVAETMKDAPAGGSEDNSEDKK